MSGNTTTWLSSANTTDTGKSKVAVITTVVFALLELLTNGGLLILLLILWKGVGRYASFIQNCVLLHIVVKAILDLTMRLPLFIMGSENVSAVTCAVLSIIPDYSMLALLLTLPLLSAERLVKLWVKPTYSRSRIRHIFSATICTIYFLALVVAVLPSTSVFITKNQPNSKCEGHLNYGLAFSYIYSGLTALTVLLVIIFSVSTVVLLRSKLRDMETTETKKLVIKRGVISALIMTTVLSIATVPFALVFQFVLMCQQDDPCIERYFTAFRTCVIIQKLSLSSLPVFFLSLNKPVRRKVWQFVRRCQKNMDITTSQGRVSTSTEKLSSDITSVNDRRNKAMTAESHHETSAV